MMQLVFQTQKERRQLLIFALHQAYFDKALKSFLHHIVIISGEGQHQTEAYYRIGGSDFTKATILFAESNHPDFFDHSATGMRVGRLRTELPDDSKLFLSETLTPLRANLSVDEFGEFWSVRPEASSDVAPTPQFPMPLVKHLQSIHWPHNYKWG
jgi:hypothetical protein